MSSSFTKHDPSPPLAGGEGKLKGKKVRGLRLAVEKVDDELVGCHHDGRVRDLAH